MGSGRCTYIFISVLLGIALVATVVVACIEFWIVNKTVLGHQIGLWRSCGKSISSGERTCSVRKNVLEFQTVKYKSRTIYGFNFTWDVCLVLLIAAAVLMSLSLCGTLISLCTKSASICCVRFNYIMALLGGLVCACAPAYFLIKFPPKDYNIGFACYMAFGAALLSILAGVFGMCPCFSRSGYGHVSRTDQMVLT